MRIAITGSSGMIGSALISSLIKEGHSLSRVVRTKLSLNNPEYIFWDTERQEIDLNKLEGYDAVIHLAGANIAGKRWSSIYKKILYDSRIKTTTFLCESLVRLKKIPRVLLSASAVGYYGNHAPHDVIDEHCLAGNDFLAKLCVDWEKACLPAREAGIRVVNIRFGVVLGTKGGALAKMLPIFKLGLGGPIASGQQMMSWIALEEIPAIVVHLLRHDVINGAVNIVSPNPVSNAEFTKILGKILRRPTVFPVPAWGLKILFGEMAETLLIGGAKVVPKRLLDSGYQFHYPELSSALGAALR